MSDHVRIQLLTSRLGIGQWTGGKQSRFAAVSTRGHRTTDTSKFASLYLPSTYTIAEYVT